MSDSFADLWNSSAPIQPSQPQPPRTLGALHTPQAQQRKPQNDVFSMLASSSNSSSRSITPAHAALSVPKAPGIGSTNGGIKPVQKATSSGGDAFSDLLGGTIAGTSDVSRMTIAERAALVEKQKQQQLKQQSTSASHPPASAWAGLDALGSTTGFSSSRASPQPPAAQPEDDWGLTFDAPVKNSASPAPASAASTVKAKATAVDDDWGLEDFISKPAPQRPTAQRNASQSLWDLDEFTSPAPANQRSSPAPANGRSSTPGSFDFGEREDGLLEDHSDGEDDILGALAKPARPKTRADPVLSRATPSPRPPPSGQRSRAVSPPPHIVGQIVEMGFTPQQARVALAATDTGLDVQAALETLIANGAASGSSPPPEPRSRERPRDRVRQRQPERYDDDDELPRQRIPARRDRQREPPSRENSGTSEQNVQAQADKLLAQASEIGLSVFNRANALWKESREKVQKAYEERMAASNENPASGSRAPKKDSRPKWMQEAEDEEVVHDDGWGDHKGGFRDGDDDHHDEVLPPRPAGPSRPKAAQSRPAPQQPPRDEPRKVKTGDLFSDDAPSVYVSPFRRKAPTRTPAAPEPAAARAPPKAPSPAPLIQRKTIPASSSEIATSTKHKTTGTEMFKLGRYAEAETSYSFAIAALPDAHLLLVPLYNNRALTRIKTGDHTGAVDDCTTVLKLIGPGYHPAREAKVSLENEGAGVDLADAYVKALRRRAEAYEGKEKWDDARKDWEAISAADWAGRARTEAASAAGRCRRMATMNPDDQAPPRAAPPKPKPKPQARPARRVPTPPSEALNRVREANNAAEAEDLQKHALKDSVDGRLLAWKGGKEANIRALIASLDTILWPELGLQKVGMHELVTPSQVKIRYTKAIAKLHPDKLNVNNTTLEQRMIANGVFGALNEAWNAFK